MSVNTLYRERIPRAIHEMEERLEKFISDNKDLLPELVNDPVTSFVHHQVIEMAKDCLQKSREKQLVCQHFYEMSENLERLLRECQEKSNIATHHLKKLIRKLMVIVSRPARLLEFLEYDPENVNRFLENNSSRSKTLMELKKQLPSYIGTKLGINRGAFLDLVNDNENEEDDNDKECSNCKEANEAHFESPVKQPCEEDYETIKLISNGAYGGVYLVRQKETRQKFAMKKIDKQSLILRNQVEQAFAERDIMSFTDNPFVVSLYCSFETKRYLCLVMEYVEGGDLATLLKNMGPLPVDLARFYFAETVLAVEYLHSYGIVHRDLKPENLLITALGHIKLTDFGLSKIGLMNLATNICEEHLSKKDAKEFLDKQVCGTPEYIAPEVISRQGYGKPVDWWSMGIILYEILIGCVPFFGETPEELFAHVINDEITWPDDEDWPLPEDAKDIITKLLRQDPLERLGAGGAHEVKEHSFFESINWDDLLRQKAEFVPQLDNDEDTSYFDTRTDRYNHEIDDSEEQDDTDESSSSMFSSFSSCSPKYHRVYSRIEQELAQEKLMKSSSTSSILDESVQTTCMNDSFLPFNSNLETVNVAGESQPHESRLPECASGENESSTEMEKPTLHSTPESSQTESEDFSPKITRRRKPFMNIKLSCIPRFSISGESDDRKSDTKSNESKGIIATNTPSQEEKEEKDVKDSSTITSNSKSHKSHIPRSSHFPVQINALKNHPKGRAVIKSASATGLSLMIPTEEAKGKGCCNITSSGGSSTSSRDTSPNREIPGGLGQQLKPPIIIRKGPRGFGFTLRAIRVYYGDSDLYTVHHLVLAVENNSPAFEAGLRPNALITHINGEPIQGLLHHQVLQLVLSGGDKINIRTTPLENTTIKTGGRRRHPSSGRMTRRPNLMNHKKAAPIKRTDSDKRRRSSLLRKLSSKRASAEIQQLMAAAGNAGAGGGSPPLLTPSRSYQSLNRTCNDPNNEISSTPVSSNIPRFPRSPPPNRLHCSPSDSSAANSSQSSSPSSSVPNSPASLSHFPHFPRPSTLSGLKQHKPVKSFRSPRRKSCGHIPLSPLARTPSPSIQPVSTNSPTRTSSTPVFPGVHQPGSSQTTQSFIIHKTTKMTDSSTNTPPTPSTAPPSLTTPGAKCFSRPKSAEPSSPLLRRALSPDRLLIKRNTDTNKTSGPLKHKRHSLGGLVSSPLAISSLPPSNTSRFSLNLSLKNNSKNNDKLDSPVLIQYCKDDKSESAKEEAGSSDESTEKIETESEDSKTVKSEICKIPASEASNSKSKKDERMSSSSSLSSPLAVTAESAPAPTTTASSSISLRKSIESRKSPKQHQTTAAEKKSSIKTTKE